MHPLFGTQLRFCCRPFRRLLQQDNATNSGHGCSEMHPKPPCIRSSLAVAFDVLSPLWNYVYEVRSPFERQKL